MNPFTDSGRSPARRAARGFALALACAALLLTETGCGRDVAARLAEAQALQDAGDFSGSIERLREIVREDPDNAEANHLLGVAYIQTRQASLSIWPLRKAMDSDEYVVLSGVLLATTLLASRSFDEGAKVAARVLEVDPNNTSALHARARANFEVGNIEEALEDAERMLTIDPEEFNALLLRGSALTLLERLEEAEQTYARLQEATEKSEDPVLAARGCLALPLFHDEQENEEQAAEAFKRCVEAYPTDRMVIRQASRFYDRQERQEEGDAIWSRAIEERPDDLELRTALAARLEGQGRKDEAREVLAEATETFGSPQAWYALAGLERRSGDLPAARAAAERALEQSEAGGPEEVRFLLADLLIELGELDRAEEIVASLEEPAYSALARGQLLLARGQPEAAKRSLEQGLGDWPNHPGARMLAGQAAEALGDYPLALEHYREAVRVDAEATDAALAMARIHFELGQYEQALYFASHHASNRPVSGSLPHVIAARCHAALGRKDVALKVLLALEKRQDEKLQAQVERAAIERSTLGAEAAAAVIAEGGLDLTDPANELALRALIGDLLVLGRADAALARVDAALGAHPEVARFHDARGRVLLQAGRVSEAKQSFEQALALEAELAAAIAGLAAVAAQEGDGERALTLFERAAQADPEDPEPGYLAAQLLLQAGRVEEAQERLGELVRQHPGHPGTCNDLAWLLAEQGRELDRALELAQRASRRSPSFETLDTLGWVQLKRGEADGAVATFEQALELNPGSDLVRDHLALARKQAALETDRNPTP